MKEKIIEPVSRIEGHAKISIHLDDNDNVEDARFHVVEFRGFEKFVEGRPFWEMPDITSRICGICPVSHHLGAAKAADAIVGKDVPEAGNKLRELLHMGQVLQSHALSFFYLSSPDLLLGYDADPSVRNVAGLLDEDPELTKKGISLRSFGQEVIKSLGEKKVHPELAVPGGVSRNLDREKGKELLEESEGLTDSIVETIDLLRGIFEDLEKEFGKSGIFDGGYMGLVDQNDGLEHYDGKLKLSDSDGEELEKKNPLDYDSMISERSKEWTYLKFPYYEELGFDEGKYRVGPLARLNLADYVGTELANKEFERYKEFGENGLKRKAIYYHYARLVEMLYCVERIQRLLKDDLIYEGETTSTPPEPVMDRGVGVIEAPRGTLIHDYEVDRNGLVEKANLIIATTHNNRALNEGVKNVAQKYVDGTEIPEGILNRIEGIVRSYDPCLSCSTHAVGEMPIQVELMSEDEVVDEVGRSPSNFSKKEVDR